MIAAPFSISSSEDDSEPSFVAHHPIVRFLRFLERKRFVMGRTPFIAEKFIVSFESMDEPEGHPYRSVRLPINAPVLSAVCVKSAPASHGCSTIRT